MFRKRDGCRAQDTSRYVTHTAEVSNGVQAVSSVLANLEFDPRAELVHIIHVRSPRDG